MRQLRIERDELREKMERGDDFTLVEVLGEDDYEDYHLPDAINVPEGDDFEDRIVEAVPDMAETVVVYCKDEDCGASPSAARKMADLGYQRVFDYGPGKEDWKAADLPIEP